MKSIKAAKLNFSDVSRDVPNYTKLEMKIYEKN
jgi:hypothetical protein